MAKKPPIFLERDRYRTRRLVDALRVLPILAGILWLVPALWANDTQNPPEIARLAIYFFCTWALMIVLSFALSRRLRHSAEFAGGIGTDGPSAPRDRD